MAEGERSEREEGQIKYRNTIQSKEQSSVTVVSSLKRQTIADSEGRTAVLGMFKHETMVQESPTY